VKGADGEPFPAGRLPSGASLAARLASNKPVEEGVVYTAAVLAALWALFDTGLDAVKDVDFLLLKIIDVVTPALINIFTWPGGVPFAAIPLDTSEDQASFANWLAAWGWILIDAALLIAGATKWASKPTIARYVDPAGKIIMSVAGGINLITGV